MTTRRSKSPLARLRRWVLQLEPGELETIARICRPEVGRELAAIVVELLDRQGQGQRPAGVELDGAQLDGAQLGPVERLALGEAPPQLELTAEEREQLEQLEQATRLGRRPVGPLPALEGCTFATLGARYGMPNVVDLSGARAHQARRLDPPPPLAVKLPPRPLRQEPLPLTRDKP